MQIHLTSSGIQTIDEIVTLADKILVSSNQAIENDPIQDVIKLTSILAENINQLTLNISQMNNKNFKTNYKNRKQTQTTENIWWYHFRFGDKALKCERFCKFFNNFQSKNLN